MTLEQTASRDQDSERIAMPTAQRQPAPPRRAPGVDLVGAVDADGYADQQWLICIDGSRYMHATRILYGVLQHADGQTDVTEIASRVSTDVGRTVTADQVCWLIQERLAPAGLIDTDTDGVGADADPDMGLQPGFTPPGGAPPARRRSRRQTPPAAPLLAIQRKVPVLPYRVTAPVTEWLQHLYAPPVMAAVVIAGAAINLWLYTRSGLGNSLHTLIFAPGLILVLLLLDVPLRLFHELGHASAMRRADVPHGDIGVALYVIVPVYYTDVTHAYRLERAERVRIDLGGMYFDLISIIGLAIAYSATRLSVLLIAMMLIGFNMLREFTPFMRFDGYYLMADVIGVHEPLSMLSAWVGDHMPGQRERAPRLRGVTTRVKVALILYLLVILAFLARPLIILNAVGGSTFVTQLLDSGRVLWSQLTTAVQAHDLVGFVTSVFQLFFWALIPLGLALFSVALARALVRGGRVLVAAARRRAEATAQARRATTVAATDAVAIERGIDQESQPPPSRPAVRAGAIVATEADGLPLIVEVDGSVANPEEPMPSIRVDDGQLELSGMVLGEPRRAVPAALEGTLERAAAHHVVELRDLVDQVRAVYEQELAAHRREIEVLRERALQSERDRDRLQASLSELETAFARHVGNLTALGDDVIRRAEVARRERDVTLALVHGS